MSHKLSWVAAALTGEWLVAAAGSSQKGDLDMKSKLSAALAASSIIAVLVGSTAARADTFVTFTLSNVTFGTPGGSASGSFVFDVTTGTITSDNITTTAAGAFPGASYTDPTLVEVGTSAGVTTFGFGSTGFSLGLSLAGTPPSFTLPSPLVGGGGIDV